MNTKIQPEATVKINKLNVNWFRNECHEQGIDWMVNNTKIASILFEVVAVIGERRAMISDGKSTMWVSQSILKSVSRPCRITITKTQSEKSDHRME